MSKKQPASSEERSKRLHRSRAVITVVFLMLTFVCVAILSFQSGQVSFEDPDWFAMMMVMAIGVAVACVSFSAMLGLLTWPLFRKRGQGFLTGFLICSSWFSVLNGILWAFGSAVVTYEESLLSDAWGQQSSASRQSDHGFRVAKRLTEFRGEQADYHKALESGDPEEIRDTAIRSTETAFDLLEEIGGDEARFASAMRRVIQPQVDVDKRYLTKLAEVDEMPVFVAGFYTEDREVLRAYHSVLEEAFRLWTESQGIVADVERRARVEFEKEGFREAEIEQYLEDLRETKRHSPKVRANKLDGMLLETQIDIVELLIHPGTEWEIDHVGDMHFFQRGVDAQHFNVLHERLNEISAEQEGLIQSIVEEP